MKIQAHFTSKDNKLFFLDGRECSSLSNSIKMSAADCNQSVLIEENSFFIINLSWQLIGKSEDSYDEAFLAGLRDFLKKMDSLSSFAVIDVVSDSALTEESQKDDFIASIKHCARRIKDCSSVIGFVIPKEVERETFCSALLEKHSHYIFFSSDNDVLQNDKIVRL